jgi:two-component system NtrC family sensor kinase
VDDIEVVTDLEESLPPTLADSHQLRQVFLNIVINAHQAMTAHRSSGCLTMKTRLLGEEIVVEIEDDGPGIDPAILGKIFDPFFTTKDVGQGTGLGLSICYGIVKEHGGRIAASNSPGGGALFVVTLPIRRPKELPAARRAPAAQPSAEPAPRARILVVDDEESIGEILSETLQHAGHTVDVAVNGLEALALIEAGSYDLIISDLKMPGMGGEDLYDRIAEQDPALARRMVFSTGDTVSQESEDFLERSGARCVQKPFDLEDVRRLVDELLTAPVA